MTDEIDDALQVALERTQAAQVVVAREIEARLMPPVPVVEEVTRRAEDLDELAQQAADQERDEQRRAAG